MLRGADSVPLISKEINMERKDADNLSFVLSNAAECTVLLKKSGQFPLDKAGKIAAYGSGLRYTIKGGTGSGEVNSKETFTIEQGLEKIAELEGIEATDEEVEAKYAEMAEMYKMDAEQLKKIIPADDVKTDVRNGKAVQLVVDNAVAEKPVKKAAKKTAKKSDSEEKAEETKADSAE